MATRSAAVRNASPWPRQPRPAIAHRAIGRLRVVGYKSKGRINKRIRVALEDT